MRTEHFGQPCQKHPSTKTATRFFGKTKSGRPIIAEPRLHPDIFAALNNAMRRSSVDALPRDRILDIFKERCLGVRLSAMLDNRGYDASSFGKPRDIRLRMPDSIYGIESTVLQQAAHVTREV